ncbi:methyltransferase family protein [Oceanomicrobium pacificus]|uniref:Isoprenylcysteine carboxylmethyltransferase family protein n=1 Tax=Oceanomicrobium pacificus TaxID=2692916 RepID=A0A6B0TUW4_9RHOB|nr:isoprenylcysteine carboxylmethyltransferase family protein [Oceanomicrobium pacificus]MXU65555.1 isoprenylcysteine carboxylmethyltransferase family protein [Oceanomicrobium pacificus]
MKHLDVPPLWLLFHLLALWLLVRAGLSADVTWGRGPGLFLCAAGLGLILWSGWHFRRGRTTIHPHGRPAALLSDGPFRINRNPIYTGMVLILTGAGLYAAVWLTPVVVASFVWLVTARFIRPEEAALRAAFPDTADAYFARIRRW